MMTIPTALLDQVDRGAAQQARAIYRDGLVAPTSGVAPGFTQANMIVLPRDWAFDILLYAQRNPKPCPVLDVSDPGAPATLLAPGADLRTDLPLYRIWRDGKLVEETADATCAWAERDDLVSFLIGCSFTFETSMVKAGIEIRHMTDKSNVPMHHTNRACSPAGRLTGNMVVSMRPIPTSRVADGATISGRFPAVHGAPVHVGAPEELGIKDLANPDFGDPVRIEAGQIPVFWACGVTPQAAVIASDVPFAITRAPGHLFLTDFPDTAYHA